EAEHRTGRARLEPHGEQHQQRAIDQDAGTLERERAGRRRAQLGARSAPRDAVRVDRAVVGNEHHERAAVAVEPGRVHTGAGRLVHSGRELLDPPLRFGLAEERRDPLDRLRPHQSSRMKRASSNSPCSRPTSSGGAGVSIESAINAWPPCRVRETVMFAMFTPASPKSVPTRPITPGTSSYRKITSSGASSSAMSNPITRTSHWRLSLPMSV